MIGPLVRAGGRATAYLRTRRTIAWKLLTMEFSPTLWPWMRLRRDDTTMGRLRRLAFQSVWRLIPSPVDRAALLASGLLWPVRAILAAAAAVRTNGAYVVAQGGRSRWTQFREAAVLALRWNYCARSYYRFHFWEPGVGGRSTQFVQPDELVTLLHRLNRGVDTRVIAHKVRFFEACRAAGLPTAPVVGVFGRDGEDWPEATPGALPRRSLFLKWADGEQGIGVERWPYDAATDRWTRGGVRYDADGLLGYCRERGSGRPLIVQLCLENHPDVARFSTGALCTFRTMTYRDSGSRAVLVALRFKMPRGGADADNFHAGGLASAVDPETGRLGMAFGRQAIDGTFATHPDTGAPIDGSVLTSHRAVVDLALRAHERLEVPWSVGWDIAPTPDGPVLVEGNPDLGRGRAAGNGKCAARRAGFRAAPSPALSAILVCRASRSSACRATVTAVGTLVYLARRAGSRLGAWRVRSGLALVVHYGRARWQFLRMVPLIDFSPLTWPWMLTKRDASPAGRIRYLATRLWRRAIDSSVDRAVMTAYGVAWPVWSALGAWRLLAGPGQKVVQAGVSRTRQWREAMWYANRLNLSAKAYYRFRLWDPAARSRTRHFVRDHELVTLFAYPITAATSASSSTSPASMRHVVKPACRRHPSSRASTGAGSGGSRTLMAFCLMRASSSSGRTAREARTTNDGCIRPPVDGPG